MSFDAVGFLNGLFDQTVSGDSVELCHPPEDGLRPDPTAGITSPDDLPAHWRERYEERAAIRHFDGGQALEHAEAEALRETVAAMRATNRGT